MSATPRRSLRLAVVGHVEHITLGRVPAPPAPGDIVHLDAPIWFPGGGGGMTLLQLAKSPAEVHVFTAVGSDEAGAQVLAELEKLGVHVHAARREEPHTRDLVLVNPDGERTILVVGEPLHPRRDDPLPWELLAACDAVYYTAQDPAVLRAARAARLLALTARRRDALTASGVRADLVLGSAHDPREAWAMAEYQVRPGAVVLTEGAKGGIIVTAAGAERFPAPPSPPRVLGTSYGCGDSFAGAVLFYLAAGLPLPEACRRAGPHGAAVLYGLDPRKTQKPLELP